MKKALKEDKMIMYVPVAVAFSLIAFGKWFLYCLAIFNKISYH